ncbi:hypothetical protein SDC9_41783 [bioreactor metagenome]|uniref:Tripartite ATP-independent periplasmic transporters DctQ component domain-containing protein n=1 Tax=bioreactor metagenome TaxID=1076179 RepID=A0A644VW34_9ZZZZ
MSILSKIMRALVKAEKTVIALFMAAAVMVIMISVIGRRIGHAPAWGEEVVRYLIIWITFIGSGVCFRRSAHYGVDVIRRVKNKIFQKFIATFVILVSAIFAAFLLIYGGKYTAFTMMSGQKTAALGLPIWLVYISVPIGGALVIIHLIELLMQDVFGVYKIEE